MVEQADQLTAGGTGTGVASLERLLSASLAEVVSAGVDDNGALVQLAIGLSTV
jgi:microcystin degradation protein MlrC